MSAATEIYYDPYDFEIDTNPYPIWRRMRDEAPVYHNEKYGFYALSRFEDVEAASTDWQTYTSSKGILLDMVRSGAPIPPGLFIAEDPPLHDVHRLLLSRAVTPRKVMALEPKIRELCAEYLDPQVGKDRFDMIAEFASKLPMRVIGLLVGIPEEDQAALKDRIEGSARLKSGELQESGIGRIGEGYQQYLDYKRENPVEGATDFISVLIGARFKDPQTGEERGLTDTEILNYIGMLYAAGNETTARLIGWLTKLLAEHPDQRAQLVEDPGLIPGAVEETLRYEVPSPVQVRVATRDVELHGVRIPNGEPVILLTGSANRDERAFPNGEAFDIHRKIDHHVTFGYGAHYCFGAALARIEGRLALEEILKRFPTWDVDLDQSELIHTATLRGYHKLPVIPG